MFQEVLMDSAQPTSLGPREVFAHCRKWSSSSTWRLRRICTPSTAFWSGHAPEGLPRRVAGREAIRRVLVPLGERARAAGHHLLGLRSMVVHDTADPEVIIAEFEVQGEVRPSGQPYQLSCIQVLRARDGEIVTFRDYWNPQALSSLLAHAKAVAGSALV